MKPTKQTKCETDRDQQESNTLDTSNTGNAEARTDSRLEQPSGQSGREHNQGNPGPERRDNGGLDSSRSINTTSQEVNCAEGDWIKLDFSIARSLRYDAKRRAFFERCNHLTRAVTAITGAGTVASVINGFHWASIVMGATVGIATALDLVVDFSSRAMSYDTLYKRFADLGIKVASSERTLENYRRFLVEKLVIEKEEPTVLSVLNVICANEELKSRAYPYQHRVDKFQKLICQFLDVGQQQFEKIEEPA
ncbi:MAG TPA: hypothetical protein VGG48_10545 [Rhizomicrobium sp.]|jgi:hypothetical protein